MSRMVSLAHVARLRAYHKLLPALRQAPTRDLRASASDRRTAGPRFWIDEATGESVDRASPILRRQPAGARHDGHFYARWPRSTAGGA